MTIRGKMKKFDEDIVAKGVGIAISTLNVGVKGAYSLAAVADAIANTVVGIPSANASNVAQLGTGTGFVAALAAVWSSSYIQVPIKLSDLGLATSNLAYSIANEVFAVQAKTIMIQILRLKLALHMNLVQLIMQSGCLKLI